MNATEATDLAVRYHKTWPNGPDAWLWEEAFKDSDAGKVGTVWAKLAKQGVNHITIPKFYELYNTLNTQDASTRPHRKDCDTCQNSGWSPVAGQVTCADGTIIEMDQGVEPCRCPWGRDREQTHQGIVDWNANELERIQPGRAARKAETQDAA